MHDKIDLKNSSEDEIFYRLVSYLRLRAIYSIMNNNITLQDNIQAFFDNISHRNNKNTHNFRDLDNIRSQFGSDDKFSDDSSDNHRYVRLNFPYTLEEMLIELHQNGSDYSPPPDGSGVD